MCVDILFIFFFYYFFQHLGDMETKKGRIKNFHLSIIVKKGPMRRITVSRALTSFDFSTLSISAFVLLYVTVYSRP